MTDRELLESAARAAGVKGLFFEICPEDGAPAYSCGIGNQGWITPPWNPLANNGDALMLAVKLRITPHNFDAHSTADAGFDWSCREDHNGDPYAATRRAIVRAAAALGEQQKG